MTNLVRPADTVGWNQVEIRTSFASIRLSETVGSGCISMLTPIRGCLLDTANLKVFTLNSTPNEHQKENSLNPDYKGPMPGDGAAKRTVLTLDPNAVCKRSRHGYSVQLSDEHVSIWNVTARGAWNDALEYLQGNQ